MAEFVEQRVQWIELLSAAANPTAPALVQALALLLQSEQELPATTFRPPGPGGRQQPGRRD